jgi:hypothetical protein
LPIGETGGSKVHDLSPADGDDMWQLIVLLDGVQRVGSARGNELGVFNLDGGMKSYDLRYCDSRGVVSGAACTYIHLYKH